MRFTLPIVFAAILLGAATAASATLYDDLGGKPGVTAIIGDSVDAAVADPRTADKFSNINVPRLKQRIAEFVCEVTDGPCHFHGVSMKGAHAQLELHDRHFNAVVEDLQKGMEKAGVPFRTQNRLLAVLAPLHRDIVSK
jgi:hemoglobin